MALIGSLTPVVLPATANAAAGTITSGGCSAAVGEVTTASISQVGTDCVIRFTSGSNSWTVPSGVTSVRYLVVAGGGAGGAAGGNDGSGGGGAGGVLAGTFSVGASSYSITVGKGGDSTTANAANHNPANFNGGNSTISGTSLVTITALGGGSGSSESNVTRVASNGGSGGGGGGYSGSRGTGTAGPPRQGYDGGATSAPGDGGGGGAGAPGGNGNSTNGGTAARAGGIGVTNDITGTSTYYGGGGGASGDARNGTTGGAGGLGGGGAGAAASSGSTPTNGVANTGGGGGGAAGVNPVGSVKASGAGGSGVVIIRFAGDTTAPIITGPSSATGATSAKSISENSTAVHTFSANETVTWSNSGTDSTFFSITSGGVLTITARDFEAPADVGSNNTYEVTITATDLSSNVKTQVLTVTITNVNEAPRITNNSSSATFAFSQPENSTSVVTYQATDEDAGSSLSFSISGGSDSADFTINSGSGVLTFTSNPDFEAPADSDQNNTYIVEISVSDGLLSDTQTVTLTITNANETASLGAPTVSGTIYKGVISTISVSSTAAGRVAFFVGGKRISTCLSRATTGSYPSFTATCSWKPPVMGRQILTARITPTDLTFSASTSAGSEVRVFRRTNSR